MINNKTDEAIKEHFLNFISRYQIWLQTSVKGSDFVWLLHYKCHEINPNWGGSYIDPFDWIKTIKSNSITHHF